MTVWANNPLEPTSIVNSSFFLDFGFIFTFRVLPYVGSVAQLGRSAS